MVEKIFFNSSLPRSGSTLLQNIFSQNPDFYSTPTSGTLELCYGARVNYSNDPTFKAQDKDLMEKGWRSFCLNGLFGFYNAITDKKYIMEKSRGWGIHYNFLEFFLPYQPKVICMVRDIKQIISSMEKKFRKNMHMDSGMVNHATMQNTSTPKRVDTYVNTQPFGLAIERLEEILREGIDKKIFFIKYEDLCSNPLKVMNSVYDYLEIPKFDHNFDYIEQKTFEDDSVYGIFGDHTIRPKLEPLKKDYYDVLGKDICQWLDAKYQWYNQYFRY